MHLDGKPMTNEASSWLYYSHASKSRKFINKKIHIDCIKINTTFVK